MCKTMRYILNEGEKKSLTGVNSNLMYFHTSMHPLSLICGQVSEAADKSGSLHLGVPRPVEKYNLCSQSRVCPGPLPGRTFSERLTKSDA